MAHRKEMVCCQQALSSRSDADYLEKPVPSTDMNRIINMLCRKLINEMC